MSWCYCVQWCPCTPTGQSRARSTLKECSKQNWVWRSLCTSVNKQGCFSLQRKGLRWAGPIFCWPQAHPVEWQVPSWKWILGAVFLLWCVLGQTIARVTAHLPFWEKRAPAASGGVHSHVNRLASKPLSWDVFLVVDCLSVIWASSLGRRNGWESEMKLLNYNGCSWNYVSNVKKGALIFQINSFQPKVL